MRSLFATDEDLLTEAAYRELLLTEFPEIRANVEDDTELTHIVTGAVESFANDLIQVGNFQRLKSIFELFAYLGRHSRQLEPGILNAIHVSFLEGLQLDHHSHGPAAERILPPVLAKMRADQIEHNRKIGWW